MRAPKDLGMTLLAAWLILFGLLTAPFLRGRPRPAVRGDVGPGHRPAVRGRRSLPPPGSDRVRLRRHGAVGPRRPEPRPPPRRRRRLRPGVPPFAPRLVLPPAVGRRAGDGPVLRPHRDGALTQRGEVGGQWG